MRVWRQWWCAPAAYRSGRAHLNRAAQNDLYKQLKLCKHVNICDKVVLLCKRPGRGIQGAAWTHRRLDDERARTAAALESK